MKKAVVALFFVITSINFLEAQLLTHSAKISLLTGSPGTELYNTFGHTAIRVKDTTQNLDTVFNYGTFDFNIPNFYIKFARGQLDYKLSVESYRQFEYGFYYENRSVIEHELNLSLSQKRRLFNLLLENYKPENRYYKYDFFFDNCATRIRDLMITAFKNDFQYHYPQQWKEGTLTFRNLIDLYLTHHHWSDFGIDLALGLPTDAIAKPADYMFLPDYLMEGFETATILQDGKKVPFTKKGQLIIARKQVEQSVFMITPMKLTWTLFIVSAFTSLLNLKKVSNTYWFDALYFSVIGIIGWVVFLLWFFTDHIATKDNMNLLWAVPVYFPGVLFWNKFPDKFKIWSITFFGGIDLIILLLWFIFPQNYHDAFIPLILIMLVRFGCMNRFGQFKLNLGKSVI